MILSDYIAIWLATAIVSWVCGVVVGALIERDDHRPCCDCERCKSWRQKMTERGKKQESK